MAEQALRCPSCQKRFKAQSYEAGKTYKCPQCNGELDPTSQVEASQPGYHRAERTVAINGPGPHGETLTLRRIEPIEVTITREIISIPTIPLKGTVDPEREIAYLWLVRCQQDTPNETQEVVRSLCAEGAKALVLDLRGNTGAHTDAVIRLADLFLDEGAIVETKRTWPTLSRTSWACPGTDRLLSQLPMVVLIDGLTIGGGEILAAALKDNGRAVLLGSPTFGRATAHRLLPVGGGAALRSTHGVHCTPNGHAIYANRRYDRGESFTDRDGNGRGDPGEPFEDRGVVRPNVWVPLSQQEKRTLGRLRRAQWEWSLRQAREADSAPLDAKQDVQLQRAVAVLRGVMGGVPATPVAAIDASETFDFDGALGPGWQWVNEDRANWSLSERPGYLRIRVQTGEPLLARTPVDLDYIKMTSAKSQR